MNFINPGILFGLLAASIPLLLHFLNRSKSKQIPFSTLSFLKELQQQRIKKLKIKQLLLLIIRTLIILLLVLAFARPTLQGSLSGVLESNAKSSLVLVLDNSYSMNVIENNQTLFNRTKDKALELVSSIRQGDNVHLVTVTDTTLFSGGELPGEFISEKINTLKSGFSTASLSEAINKAHQLLAKSQDVNKEIYVLSDLQEYSIRKDTLSFVNEQVHTYALPVRASAVQNMAINDLKIVSTILERDKLVELQVEFYNSGDTSLENTLAELFVNNEKVAQVLVQAPPHASVVEPLKFLLNNTGFVNGYVKLESDDLADDNTRYFSLYVPDQIKTAIIQLDKRDGDLFELALDPVHLEKSRYEIERINSSELSTLEAEKYNVIALVDLMAIPENSIEKLVAFVKDGGGLILVLGKNTDIQSLNRFLARADLPVIKTIVGNSISTEYTTLSMGNMDLTHPLFYGMFEKTETEFNKPRFNYAVIMDDNQSYEHILDYSTGDPCLFAKTLDSGSVLVFTSGLQIESTDLSRRTLFAPLLNRMVQFAGARYKTDSLSTETGSPLRTKVPVEKVQQKLEISRPDGSYDRIEPVMHASGPRIEYFQTKDAGIYELLADNQLLWSWAVNPDPKESDLTLADARELEERFGMEIVNKDQDLTEFMYKNRYGVELWFYFMLAALILLLVEMLVFRTGVAEETE